jgi:hypothetical protein
MDRAHRREHPQQEEVLEHRCAVSRRGSVLAEDPEDGDEEEQEQHPLARPGPESRHGEGGADPLGARVLARARPRGGAADSPRDRVRRSPLSRSAYTPEEPPGERTNPNSATR